MLIGITGRLACGKGFIARYLKDIGFDSAILSDVIAKDLVKEGIPITRTSLQDMGDKIRKEIGGGELIKRILEEMDLSKNYIFDGIRNPGEVRELSKKENFFLIAVHSSPEVRWKRIEKRQKDKDPKNWEEFLISDKRDSGIEEPVYGQQVNACMEMADFKITNNSDLESLKNQVLDVLKKINE